MRRQGVVFTHDHLAETWHPHPTPTLASRPGMSLEKVRSKYSRRKSHYFCGYIWCRPHCWCTGYHFGLVKLEVKSKTSSGVEFTAGGNTTTDGGKVWNVSNTLSYLTVFLSRLPALWRPSTRSRSTGSPSLRNGQQITGNLPGNHLSKFLEP